MESENETNFFNIYFSNIIQHTHINFQVILKNNLLHFLLRHAFLSTASTILYAINCIQYSYCLDLTSCHRVIGYRLFGINLEKYLLVAKYFNIVDTSIWDRLVVSKSRARVSKVHGVVMHVYVGEKESILLWENKNCKMQGITEFCNYSCSVATDTLGLYCSVRDRIWSWIVCLYFVKIKSVGWGLKCSAIFSLYFACTLL